VTLPCAAGAEGKAVLHFLFCLAFTAGHPASVYEDTNQAMGPLITQTRLEMQPEPRRLYMKVSAAGEPPRHGLWNFATLHLVMACTWDLTRPTRNPPQEEATPLQTRCYPAKDVLNKYNFERVHRHVSKKGS
jgi:hypothetical protein